MGAADRARPALAAASCVLLLGRPALAEPTFSFEDFFVGHVIGEGTVDNRRDGTTRTFKADFHGWRDGASVKLEQVLDFTDGEHQAKTWTFTPAGANRYLGRREDVVGEARVVESPREVTMSYSAHLPVPNHGTMTLGLEDRFVPTGPDRVEGRTDVSFLFLGVATVTTQLRKLPR